jgi:hypothetical protein
MAKWLLNDGTRRKAGSIVTTHQGAPPIKHQRQPLTPGVLVPKSIQFLGRTMSILFAFRWPSNPRGGALLPYAA